MDKFFDNHINYFQALGLPLTGILSEWPVIGNFMKNGQPIEKIEHLIADNLYGIGLSLGEHGQNDFLCIDIDYCIDYSEIQQLLDDLNLPKDYEWVVKSGGGLGYHIIVDCDHNEWIKSFVALDKSDEVHYVTVWDYGETILRHKMNFEEFLSYFSKIGNRNYSFTVKDSERKFLKLELLWSKHCVLPSSMHKSGMRYRFVSEDLPFNPPQKISSQSLFKVLFDTCINQASIELAIRSQYYKRRGLTVQNAINNHQRLDLGKSAGIIDNVYLILDIKYVDDTVEAVSVTDMNFPEYYQMSWIVTDGKRIHYTESALNGDLKSEIPSAVNEKSGFSKEHCNRYGRPEYDICKMLIEDLSKADRFVSLNGEREIKTIKNLMFRMALPFDIKKLWSISLLGSYHFTQMSNKMKYEKDDSAGLKEVLTDFEKDLQAKYQDIGGSNSNIDVFFMYQIIKEATSKELIYYLI
jgi:hypothetical protein